MPADAGPAVSPHALPGRVPEIIAHRGAPREHPENSLPGFARALELGADGIELDVHVSADGVPVVHHDAALRTGLHAGRAIAELTTAELRASRLGPGIEVPTLSEVRDLVTGRATLYVEVKAPAAARAVIAVLSGLGRAAPVHAFDHRVSLLVQRTAPETPVGILSESYLVDTVAALRAARARDLWQHWTQIDAELVASVHAGGGRVIAWTVNDLAVARTLAGLGVDGLCTDVPGALRTAFPRVTA